MTIYLKMNIVHIMMNSVTTKDEILEAAKREAKDKGLESIGMREIARASNISLGTLYRKTAVKLPPFKVEDARLKNECLDCYKSL